MSNRGRGTACVDCGAETMPTEWLCRAEFYIVTDEVWAASAMTPTGGCLCVGCLEARLGRQLTPADFPDLPVNDLTVTDDRYAWSFRTPRLVARLSGRLASPLDEDTPAAATRKSES